MNGIGSTIHFPPFKAITEIDLCAWLGLAEPGEALEYHRGFLGLDRGGSETERENTRSHALNDVANRAYDLTERGFVHLVQSRLGPDTFSYLAIARPLPEGKAMDFTTLMSEEAA